jgi:hypothetical protein
MVHKLRMLPSRIYNFSVLVELFIAPTVVSAWFDQLVYKENKWLLSRQNWHQSA